MSDQGPAVAIFCDPHVFATIETAYTGLIAGCRKELDALPTEMTTALHELVALIGEGLVHAAAQQAETATSN